MQPFSTIQDLHTHLKEYLQAGKTIGLVPTMGALHDGHMSLVEASLKENDITVVSIFVNPQQFNNPNDLENYPRNLEQDLNLLSQVGQVISFAPSAEEIYPMKPTLTLDFGYLQRTMEGEFRPGHFNGVGIVVAKLFNIVNPSQAYFGQKDLQQFAVIRQMVNDLSFPVKLRCMPIVRESDGLALSSRNKRLNRSERAVAPIFYRCLERSLELIKAGVSINGIEEETWSAFEASPATLDYIKIVDPATMKPVEHISEKSTLALCIAGYVGEVRLIDNLIVEHEH